MFCDNKDAQNASRVRRKGVILFDKVCQAVTVRSPDEIGESLWIVSLFFTWKDSGKPRDIRRQQNMPEIKRRSSRTAGTTPCCAVLAYYSRKTNYSQTPISVIQTNCVSSLVQCADYFSTGALPLYHGICCVADGHSLVSGEIISECVCWLVNTLRTGLLNCLNARSRGLTFRHRASCI